MSRVRSHLVEPLAVEADLEIVGAGDVGHRSDPADQPAAIHAEVARAVGQARDEAALFVDLHQSPTLGRRRFAVKTVRIADAHVHQELVRQGRRPVELLHAPVSPQSRDVAGRRRLGGNRRTVGADGVAPLALALLVPEDGELVALRNLPREAHRGVPIPIVIGGPAIVVRIVGPGVRVAGVLVGPHVGDVGHVGLVSCGREVPQPVPLDRAAHTQIELRRVDQLVGRPQHAGGHQILGVVARHARRSHRPRRTSHRRCCRPRAG